MHFTLTYGAKAVISLDIDLVFNHVKEFNEVAN